MDLTNEKNKIQQPVNSQGLARLAERLRTEAPNVLALWEQRVREEVEAAKNLQTIDLKNSLPLFIDNLACALEYEVKNKRLEIKVAREHGKERASFSQYTLEQIITEYRILRRTIFDVIGDVSPEERDTIIDAIEIGISEAASEFATQQFLYREQFVSMLAHDLRNPLSAAKTNAQLILKTADKSNSLQLKAAAKIIKTIDRTDNLIKDLLDSNLMQMGQKFPLEIKKCDLILLVKTVIEEVSQIYGDRFLFEMDSGNITGYWDSLLLQRSIGNLLTNAIKYGDTNAPVIITINQNEKEVMIAVQNNGKAIPISEQEGLFNNFYRASKALADHKDGWGIGLFLVKGAMTAHGGTVQVRSNELEGTTFTMILPKDCRYIQKDEELNSEDKVLH